MFTMNSDGDISTHCCADCIVNIAFVDKHSSNYHCLVPNSRTACFVHHCSIHIQLIRMDRRVATSGAYEGDDLSLAICCFAWN